MRTAAAWLVSVTAAAGGVLAAHAVAYGALAPTAHGASHGYLPIVEAVVCGALALAFALAALSARAGPLARPRPAPYAAAAPLALLLQETAERGFALPLDAVVLLGLALQLPFALAAYAAARLLLRTAEAVACAGEPRARRGSAPLVGTAAPSHEPRVRTPCVARASRAPPALSV